MAQLTLTYGCAAISLQFVRSSTYRKPFLFAWIITLRSWPPTWMSASTLLVGAVHVVHVVRRVLEVAGDLAGLRPDRQHARREQAVQRPARLRIVQAPRCRCPSRRDRAADRRSPSATSDRRRTSRRRCPSATSPNQARRARESCTGATVSSRCPDPSRRGIRASSTRRPPCPKSARRWRRSARRWRSSLPSRSANFWFQTSLPVFMSSASRWLSKVTRNSLPL